MQLTLQVSTRRICGFIAAGIIAWLVALCPVSLQAEEMNYPLAVVANTKGEIFIADRYLPGIWKITAGKLEVFHKAEKKFGTPLNAPRCLAIDNQDRLLVGDSSTREVYRFDEQGKPHPLTKGENGGIGIPMGIVVDRQGNIFVSDLEVPRIWKLPAAGGRPIEFAELEGARGLTVDSQDRLWAVSQGKTTPRQLVRISTKGEIETIVEGRPFQFPHAVILDQQETAFVCDGYAKTIWKIERDRQPVKWVHGKPFANPVDLAWQGENILVIDSREKKLFQIDTMGNVTALTLERAK